MAKNSQLKDKMLTRRQKVGQNMNATVPQSAQIWGTTCRETPQKKKT